MLLTRGESELIFSFPGHPLLRLTMMAGGVVRVTRTRNEAFLDRPSDVAVHPCPCGYRLIEEPNGLRVVGDGVAVEVNRATGSLTFSLPDGAVLLREDARRPCLMSPKPLCLNRFREDGELVETQGADGVRASAVDDEARFDRTAWECRHHLVFDAEEGLYGLGSHEEGYGNLRGKSRLLYQHNLKAVVPVLVSTKGWGLLYDLGCFMAFHDDAEGSYLWAEYADEMDFYFMGGGSYERVMASYAALTGPTPMLPKYAFGYAQSKERYRDAEELLAVAREYRRRGVPLDTVVLDWCSWPDGQWGWKELDRSRFPDPRALTDELHALGVRMMISIWPSMQGEDNLNRREMLREGCMLGNRTIYNAFDPEARRLYWQQAEKGLFRHGIDAWWCDCSEPFEADWHGAIKPETHERARLNTDEAKKYLDPAKISLYSLYHARGIYEGQRGSGSSKRVYNLTRSSWAGQHRYATVTWSGDVSAIWETLRRHIPEGLNFCATGESYWSTDIGGFFPGPGEEWFRQGDYPLGVDDPGYRELYVRWAQYAAFLPVMRSHGTGTPREIWRFGEKGEPFYDAIESAIRLRYALLPYLYALAAECTRSGMPLLRVPALVFSHDAEARRHDDTMMLGDGLLVKPVTRPMRPGDTTETVYLPEWPLWYALDAGECHEGGQTVRYEAPLERIPVFARAGTILPLGPVTQHTGERPDELSLTVYPGADGAMTLYDDAGDGYGYENGFYVRMPLSWQDAAGCLTIGAREGRCPDVPERLTVTVRRVGGAARTIVYTGDACRVNL